MENDNLGMWYAGAILIAAVAIIAIISRMDFDSLHSANSAEYDDSKISASEQWRLSMSPTGNAIIITKSASHKPNNSYLNGFNRPANFTIKIPAPNVLRGVTPRLPAPKDLQYDVIRKNRPVTLDPRTCPDNLAICYQIIEHDQNRTTYGKNYSGTSQYLMPELRIREYLCVGDDKSCTSNATSCYCPTAGINQFHIKGENGKCSDKQHLCTNSYADLKLCKGNFTECKKKYLSCGCGINACISNKNTCLDKRGTILECDGDIASCLMKYSTCYCGSDMLLFKTECKTAQHTCINSANKTVQCIGPFRDCITKYDTCTC